MDRSYGKNDEEVLLGQENYQNEERKKSIGDRMIKSPSLIFDCKMNVPSDGQPFIERTFYHDSDKLEARTKEKVLLEGVHYQSDERYKIWRCTQVPSEFPSIDRFLHLVNTKKGRPQNRKHITERLQEHLLETIEGKAVQVRATLDRLLSTAVQDPGVFLNASNVVRTLDRNEADERADAFGENEMTESISESGTTSSSSDTDVPADISTENINVHSSTLFRRTQLNGLLGILGKYKAYGASIKDLEDSLVAAMFDIDEKCKLLKRLDEGCNEQSSQ